MMQVQSFAVVTGHRKEGAEEGSEVGKFSERCRDLGSIYGS
ncbi:hypothetical protein AAHB65_09680 [Bacillus toyonensis]